jgi:histone H4
MSKRGKGDTTTTATTAMKKTNTTTKKAATGGTGAMRHRKPTRDALQSITKPAIVRLARRGGVKRLSFNVYQRARELLKTFAVQVLTDAVTFTEYARRRTITGDDVLKALRNQGRTLYSTES